MILPIPTHGGEINNEILASGIGLSLNNVDEDLRCRKCKNVAKTETGLLKHLKQYSGEIKSNGILFQ